MASTPEIKKLKLKTMIYAFDSFVKKNVIM